MIPQVYQIIYFKDLIAHIHCQPRALKEGRAVIYLREQCEPLILPRRFLKCCKEAIANPFDINERGYLFHHLNSLLVARIIPDVGTPTIAESLQWKLLTQRWSPLRNINCLKFKIRLDHASDNRCSHTCTFPTIIGKCHHNDFRVIIRGISQRPCMSWPGAKLAAVRSPCYVITIFGGSGLAGNCDCGIQKNSLECSTRVSHRQTSPTSYSGNCLRVNDLLILGQTTDTAIT